MTWLPAGNLPVDFNEAAFFGVFVGDELIKVEHDYNGSSFPGTGYAMLSNLFLNGEREFFRRSYPFKNSPRIYRITVSDDLKEANYHIYQLTVRRSLRSRVDANANWRIRIFKWVDGDQVEPSFDGQIGADSEVTNLDGNP